MKERIIKEKYNFKIPRRPVRAGARIALLAYFMLGVAAGQLGTGTAMFLLGLLAGVATEVVTRYIGVAFLIDVFVWCHQNKERIGVEVETTTERVEEEEKEIKEEQS